MNDEELWEIENPQNPWLIKEEEQKDVQREEKLTKEKESPTFFRGGEKVEKRKIIREIEKGKGGDGGILIVKKCLKYLKSTQREEHT